VFDLREVAAINTILGSLQLKQTRRHGQGLHRGLQLEGPD